MPQSAGCDKDHLAQSLTRLTAFFHPLISSDVYKRQSLSSFATLLAILSFMSTMSFHLQLPHPQKCPMS